MERMVSKRWQTVIPAAIRRRHNIQEGDTLEWIDDGQTIRVVPITSDPVRALRGRAKGERLNKRLLAARAEDRRRDRRSGMCDTPCSSAAAPRLSGNWTNPQS
jgi:AbrB family looped-hinge helix DNA binding protein